MRGAGPPDAGRPAGAEAGRGRGAGADPARRRLRHRLPHLPRQPAVPELSPRHRPRARGRGGGGAAGERLAPGPDGRRDPLHLLPALRRLPPRQDQLLPEHPRPRRPRRRRPVRLPGGAGAEPGAGRRPLGRPGGHGRVPRHQRPRGAARGARGGRPGAGGGRRADRDRGADLRQGPRRPDGGARRPCRPARLLPPRARRGRDGRGRRGRAGAAEGDHRRRLLRRGDRRHRQRRLDGAEPRPRRARGCLRLPRHRPGRHHLLGPRVPQARDDALREPQRDARGLRGGAGRDRGRPRADRGARHAPGAARGGAGRLPALDEPRGGGREGAGRDSAAGRGPADLTTRACPRPGPARR